MEPQYSKRRRLNGLSQDLHSQESDTSISKSISSESAAAATTSSENHDKISRNGLQGSPEIIQYGAKRSLDGSYCSDLFELQIGELLEKIRPKYKSRMAKAEIAIHELRDIIESIPEREGLPAPEAQAVLEKHSGIRMPYSAPNPAKDSQLLLAYSKPANINVVGSYARRTALLLDGKVTIDMTVTMPSHFFQANDYRNYRYFYKRAFYLACLAAGIQNSNASAFSLSFAYQDDNPLQPIIVVSPRLGSCLDQRRLKSSADGLLDKDDGGFAQPQCTIRVILAASGDLFPLEKTLPDKTCIRSLAADGQPNEPSPTYNATLRSECCSLASLKQLHKSLVQSSAFQDASMLGTVWLHQRGLGSAIGKGGFGQFEWVSIMSTLLRGGGPAGRPVLSSGYSSYQLFKATLQYLSTTDLITKPMIIQPTSFKLMHTGRPVFFDGARGLNLLFKMSSWSYRRLRHEANISVKTLKTPLTDRFKSLFISRVDEPSKMFDHIFQVSHDATDRASSGKSCVIYRTVDLANSVYEKFSYGLGDRAVLIYPQIPTTPPWRLNQTPVYGCQGDISVGLLLNPEHCRRIVDRGPSVDDKSAAAIFRKFWGDKAELRRFKDGTILESLIWNGSDTNQAVIDQIITYILQRHFDQQERASAMVSSETFDRLLPQQTATQPDMLGVFASTTSAFEFLSKSIRAMDGLPLSIRTVSAASPELRYSSLYAPVAGKQKSPIEVHIQFEGSTRWPQDLIAIQRTKIAFLLKIADCLEKEESVSAVCLGLDSPKYKILEHSFLDIATIRGVVFRLQIYHDHEMQLLEQALNGQARSSASKEEAALAIAEFKRRLLKKWRDSHLLSSHIRDELIELLVIHTFVSAWNWQSEPLIVDFNSELTKQDIEAINVRFEAWRKLDPVMNRVAMFAASNIDRGGITWTDRHPAKIIASRFTNLAKAACSLVEEQGLNLKSEALFVPSLSEYDFVVHLKPEYSVGNTKKSPFKNLQVNGESDPFAALHNPLQLFFDELENLYGDNIIFFYNVSAPSVVAGLWNPQTGPRNWKVNLDYSTMPLPRREGAKPHIIINKEATLHDIARLGGDMATRIDQNL
ncbi:MAG: hypothetical protein Q9201_001360 [Fulgogasparrea decipioides]